jgi:para-nitrobenzyl esterase
MNYRLGSLGFLASREMEQAAENGDAVLNAGLYDIQFSLMWVQENIGEFGGDKDKVPRVLFDFL